MQTDERAAFAFDMYQACTEQLLQWVYPPLYPVHDASTPWGKPDETGRCALFCILLLLSTLSQSILKSMHEVACPTPFVMSLLRKRTLCPPIGSAQPC